MVVGGSGLPAVEVHLEVLDAFDRASALPGSSLLEPTIGTPKEAPIALIPPPDVEPIKPVPAPTLPATTPAPEPEREIALVPPESIVLVPPSTPSLSEEASPEPDAEAALALTMPSYALPEPSPVEGYQEALPPPPPETLEGSLPTPGPELEEVLPAPAEIPGIEETPTQTAALTPAMEPLAPGQVLRITFAPEEADLPDGTQAQLDALVAQLRTDERARLQLKAFASGTSETASQARRLSLSRALAVRSYLIEQGVRSTRIDVRALGSAGDEGPSDRVDIIVMNR